MREKTTSSQMICNKLYYLSRISALLSVVFMLFPAVNPARICGYINKNMSLFTSGIAYSDLISECGRAFTKGWIKEISFKIVFGSSLTVCVGIALVAVCACMSLGNVRMKKAGNIFGMIGAVIELAGLCGIRVAYNQIAMTTKPVN